MSDLLKGVGPAAAAGFDQAKMLKSAASAENLAKAAGGKHTAAEAEKAATQFEALLLHQMINEMWSSVPKGGFLSGSSEEAMYRDMFNEALATNIAETKSIGVKDVILRELKAREGNGDPSS